MPVTTYTEAARILRLTDDTLRKHRRRFGDTLRRPWWENEEAVRAWYKALIATETAEAAK